MKELEQLVNELRRSIDLKEKEIPINDTNKISLIANRKMEISSFEFATKNASKDPTLKNIIIKNFREDANKILEEINKI